MRRRVLLIDDDSAVRGALGRLLGRKHDVVQAEGSAQAAELLERDAAYDAILCDVVMPDSDRIDAWMTIVDRFPSLRHRIALVTGGAFDETRRSAIERSGLPTLTKPCGLAQLLEMVERLAGSPSG